MSALSYIIHLSGQDLSGYVQVVGVLAAPLLLVVKPVRERAFGACARAWTAFARANDLARENRELRERTAQLVKELSFITESRDDYEGFVADLGKRMDHISEELSLARADLLRFQESNRRKDFTIGQLCKQLISAGLVPCVPTEDHNNA
jgi:cell shape-determining protein MreC